MSVNVTKLALTALVLTKELILSMPSAVRRYMAGVISMRYLLSNRGLVVREKMRAITTGKKNHKSSSAVQGFEIEVARLLSLLLCRGAVEPGFC